MLEAKFKSLYEQLNSAQKEAVDSIEGPVLVIAGPGTGKTQILTLRIANILRITDASPESILAITFTDSGVSAMRQRLLSIIGAAAYRVSIFTFHGFANFLIQNHPEEFPRLAGARDMTDIERNELMEKIIDGTQIRILKPFGSPYYFVGPILSAIKDLKKENISPAVFLENISAEEAAIENVDDLYHEKGAYKGKMKKKYIDLKKSIEKNKELQDIYRLYEEYLSDNHLYDYEDMILELIRAMENNSDFLLSLQESYQYILADEHQDANQSQNRILELLSGFHNSPNLFIVGDEKQAIYAFQGASLDNFLYFQRLYPDAKVIFLEDNYRSSQTILDASRSLMLAGEKVDGGDVKCNRLKQKSGHSEIKVCVAALRGFDEEAVFVAEEIKGRISSGGKYGQFAVLCRTNAEVEAFALFFEKFQIPFALMSDQDVLADDDIKKLIVLIRAVVNFGDDEFLVPVLHLDFLSIDELFIFRLLNHSARSGVGLYALISNLDSLSELTDKKSGAVVYGLYKQLASLKKMSENFSSVKTFERIVTETGFLKSILGLPNSGEKISKLNILFDFLKRTVRDNASVNLFDFLRQIDIVTKKRMVISRSSGGRNIGDRVFLMTAHKSKGMEFDIVFIVSMNEGNWSGRRGRRHFNLPVRGGDMGTGDDERRLFYVAMTRAKKEVIITWSRGGSSGRENLPSRFLEELDSSFLDSREVEDRESPISFIALKEERKDKIDDRLFLADIFLERGLSATALNNYLKCPWNYFYNNLLKIPRASTRSALLGTTVHAALKSFFNLSSAGKHAGKEDLLSFFQKAIERAGVFQTDLPAIESSGRRMLSNYFDAFSEKWQKTNLLNEFFVKGVLLDGKLRLTGSIDKIEILNEKLEVRVIDYKTSKPKTRGEILGETKGSDGSYFRQLVFYKLLLDNYCNGKYKVAEAVIEFIEPNSSGKYKSESFSITDDDCETLSREIRRVASEIESLSFWDSRCADKECRYCLLRECL